MKNIKTSKNVYKPSKKNWVKLWVDEWLTGTTRFELSEKQRSIWIDLLAMAGKSRFPGIIASGKYDNGYRGYPLSYLSGTLVYDATDFKDALNQCEKYGKIKIEYMEHDGSENVVIFINSWAKYQSEYLRQRKYTENEKDISDIFNFWNEHGIQVHQNLTETIKVAVAKAMQSYSVDEIKKAISTYSIILKDSVKYWFGYKWSLQEFCSRENGIVKFIDEKVALENYKRSNNGNKPQANKQITKTKRITPAEAKAEEERIYGK